MDFKGIFEATVSLVKAAGAIPGLSVFVGAVWLLPETERRANRVFSSNKEELAVRFRNPLIPWIDHENSPWRRFRKLQEGFGFWRAPRMLWQNAVTDKCRDWSGAERRIRSGVFADRSPDSPNKLTKRETDSPEFIARINRRIAQSSCN